MRKRNILAVSIISVALILGLIPNRVNATPTSKATEYGLSNPKVEQDDTVTWDCIYFGNYWQNDTNGDGKADQSDEKEPIKWRVLSVNGDDAFLLADKGLDGQAYNSINKDVVWANSTLRKWLNDEFYNTAFTNSEQSSIIKTDWLNEDRKSVTDKVSVLSLTEACNAKYGFNSNSNAETETRKAQNTEYAKTNNGVNAYEGTWWLRSYNDWLVHYYYIEEIGSVYSPSTFFIDEAKSVRPCIHLNLSSNTWSKADTVTATGGTFATPTPDPTPTPTPKPTATPAVTPIITPIPTNPIGVVTNSPIKPTETATPTPTSTPTPRTITAPSKPTKLSAKNNKKKSVTLSWKKVNGATGYQIQYAANTAFAKKKLKSTKKTKLVIKNLKKKKTYSFRVRAYKVSNNVKVYGNWSKVKKVKIKK